MSNYFFSEAGMLHGFSPGETVWFKWQEISILYLFDLLYCLGKSMKSKIIGDKDKMGLFPLLCVYCVSLTHVVMDLVTLKQQP